MLISDPFPTPQTNVNPSHPMKTKSIHRYLGSSILPCSYAESTQAGFRWYVESIHTATGIPYGEQDSKRVRSLAAAREYIRECARAASY